MNKKDGINLNQGSDSSKKQIGLLFGHSNWNFMMDMMIGFRQGLKMLLEKEEILEVDYMQVVRHDLNRHSFEGKFNVKDTYILYEYAPYVFDSIRSNSHVDRQAYQKSIGPENMLGNLLLGYLDSMTELASEGKSGSIFYLTPDKQYFVKTIRKSEFQVMIKCLKKYHEHLKRNTNSLIYKITGLYSIDTYIRDKRVTMYVQIMKNVFSQFLWEIFFQEGNSVHQDSKG